MKKCPICRRDYPEATQFCTRDGTRLEAISGNKSCPQCTQKYSATTSLCPIHQLELKTDPPDVVAARYCRLCRSYYPSTTDNCPLHGISLQSLESNKASQKIKSQKLSANSSLPAMPFSQKRRLKVTQAHDPAQLTDASPALPAPVSQVAPEVSLEASREASREPLSDPIQYHTDQNIRAISSDQLSDELLVSPQAEAPNVERTKETQPSLPSMFSGYTSLQEHGRADHRLVKRLAVVVAVLISAFTVYSLPRIYQQIKMRSATQPGAEISTPVVSSTEKGAEVGDGEIVQQIEQDPAKVTEFSDEGPLPETIKSPETAKPNATKPAEPVSNEKTSKTAPPKQEVTQTTQPVTQKPATKTDAASSNTTKIASTNTKPAQQSISKPAGKGKEPVKLASAKESKTQRTSAKSSATIKDAKVTNKKSSNDRNIYTARQQKSNSCTDNKVAAAKDSRSKPQPNMAKQNGPTGNVVASNTPRRNEPPIAAVSQENRPSQASATIDSQGIWGTPGEMVNKSTRNSSGAEVKLKSNQPQVRAQVNANIANKSRSVSPQGYTYHFDLVLKETAGRSIHWNQIEARKVSYSGRSNVINGLSNEKLSSGGTTRYRMVVKMSGNSIEDWFGQIIYTASGVDENGNRIEIQRSFLLDDSFPIQ